MIVYVDLSAVINLCVDALLLFITASLLRRPVKLWRVLTAALLGSLFAVATLFPGTQWLNTFVAKWMCSVVMVDWAFATGAYRTLKYRVWLRVLQQVAAFYGVTFATGGAVYALHTMFAPVSSPFAGLALVSGQIVWWTSIGSLALVTALPTSLFFVRYALGHIKQRQRDHLRTCEVTLRLNGHECTIRALIDTGNELRDPLSRTPVAVVHAEQVASLLPLALQQWLLQGRDPLRALYEDVPLQEIANKIAIVPFRGVGGRSGQLLAVRLESATVLAQEGRLELPPLLIALQLEPLSAMATYACILPATIAYLLEEGREVVDSGSHQAVSETIHSSHSA